MSVSFCVNPETATVTFCCNEELRVLFSFYLYLAPNINSYLKGYLSYHDGMKAFAKIVKKCKDYKVINPNANMEKRLNDLKLANNTVQCMGKRFVIKKKNTKENEIDCLLRHIRNSIAHGRVFIKENGRATYIMFEDFDSNKKGITGRIICTQGDLIAWKKIIENEMNKTRKVI